MTPAAERVHVDLNRIGRLAFIVGIVGLLLCALGFFLYPARFFQSYLFGFLFWNGFSVGCLGLLLLHNVVGGNWGVVIRRFLEAAAKTSWMMAILALPILLGMGYIFWWSTPAGQHDPNVQAKAAYLNLPFFWVRAVIYFAVWIFLARRVSAWGDQLDRTGDLGILERMRAFSAPSLVVFVFTATFAFFDWIMSLEPHWFSTIYGIMFLVGQVLASLCLCVALLVVFYPDLPFSRLVKTGHFHDLGNLMLAFTILWAYLSLDQFLIIWAGNLPEEIPWYLRRFTGGWGFIGGFLGIFHFFVPFFILLHRFVKKNPRYLQTVAIYIICIRFIDVFWIVMPAFRQRQFYIDWLDIAAPLAVGGFWIGTFVANLKSRPLLPLHDPRLGYQEMETLPH